MAFDSAFFLCVALPVGLALYLAVPARARRFVLLLESAVFIAWASPWFLLPLGVVTLVDWMCGRVIARGFPNRGDDDSVTFTPGLDRTRSQRLALAISIATTLGLLCLLKYATFAWDNISAVAAAFGMSGLGPSPHLALPLGISFYTFQSLGTIIEIYRGKVLPPKSLLDYACFLAMFPRFAAGPILRLAPLAKDLAAPRVSLSAFGEGAALFAFGLGKKVLLANPCGNAADLVFSAGALDIVSAWTGVVAFTLQIFFDFAGYTDMARGLGRMLGFELPENFNAPYRSASIAEFWRRWHMSLSNWLRDYIFLPVAYAASRRFERLRLSTRTEDMASYTTAAMTTMLLAGLWHGAAWTFVVWGGLHGAAMVAERRAARLRAYRNLPHGFKVALTMGIVMVAWVFFRADSFAHSASFLVAMVGLGEGGPRPQLLVGAVLTPYLLLTFLAGLVTIIVEKRSPAHTRELGWGRAVCAVAVFALALAVMLGQTARAFIYTVF